MTYPRVSVCMPSYNQSRYIAAALDSALAQTYDDFELLVIDDCSTDGTREIVAGYAVRDRRVRLVTNETNQGMVPNWNSCLASSLGIYVKFLFGDDLLLSPDALTRMVAVLDADSTVSLVTSARALIDGEGCRTGTMAPFSRDLRLTGTKAIPLCLMAQRNLVGEPSAVMFRKGQAGRGFDPRYRQYVDLEMWFNLLEQGDLCYFRQPMVAFRQHGDQQTVVNVRNLVHIDELLSLYRVYLERPYVRLGRFGKQYLVLSQQYRIWKLCQQGTISRREAEEKIESGYGMRRFMRQVPLYKLVNPLWKGWMFMARHCQWSGFSAHPPRPAR